MTDGDGQLRSPPKIGTDLQTFVFRLIQSGSRQQVIAAPRANILTLNLAT
jgi:hypothetical protein